MSIERMAKEWDLKVCPKVIIAVGEEPQLKSSIRSLLPLASWRCFPSRRRVAVNGRPAVSLSRPMQLIPVKVVEGE